MYVAVSLVLLAVVESAAETGLVVLENSSAQPFVYQFYYGYDPVTAKEPWTSRMTVPAGERRTIGAPVSLYIGYRDGERWQSYPLAPGNLFCFRQDEKARGLFLSGTAGGRQENLREIKVLAVADIEYRNRFPDWEARVGRLIASASRYYESEFGIRFGLFGCRPWEFNARYQPSLDEKLASLTKIDLGDADIAIAFIRSVRQVPNSMILGWSLRLSEYVVVVDSWPELAEIIPLSHREHIWKLPEFGSTVVLVHELGHTLGGFHLDDLNSIMCPQPSKMIPPRIQFDEFNRQVILGTRNVDFRRGPDSISRQAALQIRALYQQHRLASEPLESDPITSAYAYRATLASISHNRPLADQMKLRAATWWSEPGPEGPRPGYANRPILSPDAGSAGNPPPAIIAKPRFPSTSTQPVLLRYRFPVGKTFEFGVDTCTTTNVQGDQGNRKSAGTVRLRARCEVLSATAEGNAELTLTVTQVSVLPTASGEAAFDSQRDHGTSEPRFQALMALVNRPLPVSISPRGRPVRVDLKTLIGEIRSRGGEPSVRAVTSTVDLAVKSAFLKLPEEAMKPGDEYDPGEFLTTLPDGGQAHTAMSCRLTAVSGDGKMAILELTSRSSIQIPGREPPRVALDRVDVSGWILFDLDSGHLARSSRQSDERLMLTQGPATSKVDAVSQTSYVCHEESLRKAP